MLEFMLLKGAFPARTGKKKIKVLNPYFFPYFRRKVKTSMLLNDMILDFIFLSLLVTANSFYGIFLKLVHASHKPLFCDLFLKCSLLCICGLVFHDNAKVYDPRATLLYFFFSFFLNY